MTNKEIKDNRGELLTQYFGRCPSGGDLPYSENYENLRIRIDYDTNELIITLVSTWNSTYNKEIKIKL